MAVITPAKYRRVVGTILRGVGSRPTSATLGLPLKGARVVFRALIKSASLPDSDQLFVLDEVVATTDMNGKLIEATTGQEGIPLLVTDDDSIGAEGWSWKATITAPGLEGEIVYIFPLPYSTADYDIADARIPGVEASPSTVIFQDEPAPAGFAGYRIDSLGNVRAAYL
ncbi:hypothetical protein [Pseudoclavibacter terrae]|uniref:Uncharacterized protein n=1 Tax=Pseudoclavibacter terrae TaxID=1530195 RepID=A0A7J5B6W4_9MICO|nr:hypothetical protein [Pseudoclavibacter terrae]KAB1639874.1 hypothetical protein F8O03_06075 [Pseudoclavibacter terrae]